MTHKILKEWEWKYKMFFNDKVKSVVTEFLNILPEPEKALFQAQIDFYSSFYTMELLLEALNDPTLDAQETLDKALEHVDLCQKTNPKLIVHFEEEIRSFPENMQHSLRGVLDASKKNREIYYRDYLTICFNEEQIAGIDKLIALNANIKLVQNEEKGVLIASNRVIKDEYSVLMKQILKNKEIKTSFGEYCPSDYDIKIVDDEGFGEWWDHELYDEYAKDTLVLFANKQSLNKQDFIYTILHEVYPGHAHFFARTKKTNKILDTGAFLLIEGYATFVEINSLRSAYATNLRGQYARTIKTLLNNSYDNLNHELIRMSSQKIGYIEAYYYGAFAIEYMLNKKNMTVIEFLDFLDNSVKGDFFKLW